MATTDLPNDPLKQPPPGNQGTPGSGNPQPAPFPQGIPEQNIPAGESTSAMEGDFERQVNKAGYYKPNAPQQKKAGGGAMNIVIIVVVLAIILGVGYYAYKNFLTTAPPPVINSTPNNTINYNLSGCTAITSPGNYTIVSNISTNIGGGACIYINSSNVWLDGKGNGVSGSGPYTINVPPTYAIKMDKVNNVHIYHMTLSKFSYGIYASDSKNLSIKNTTIDVVTLSGIYLLDSPGAALRYDNVTQVSSVYGGVSLLGSSKANITNSIIQNNAYYGVTVVNSMGNRFMNDKLINNPVDFLCNGTSGFASYSNFSGSTCQSNSYCNFVKCFQTNIPYNVSATVLSPKITTCGTIINGGTYNLQNGMSISQFINVSEPGQADQACILVKAPNVRINCNGFSILNGGYGIYEDGGALGLYNISVTNCDFINDTKAVYIQNIYGAGVTNIRISDAKYGLSLDNVTASTVNNVLVSGSTYGVYLENTSDQYFSNVTAEGNTYGIYVQSAGGTTFSQGTVSNNINTDLYCSADSYNSSNLFEKFACGSTDCNWGRNLCSVHRLPPIGTYFINSCTNILASGSYELSTGVSSANNCMKIEAPNVTFSCGGRNMIGTGVGSAFVVSNEKNVTITDCTITGYYYGVTATNSKGVNVTRVVMNYTGISGISYSNVNGGGIYNVTVYRPDSTGAVFNNVTHAVISNSNVSYSRNQSGFIFNGSSNNTVSYDAAIGNQKNGFNFTHSKFNNVFNNTGSTNLQDDFYCSPDSSGLYAETNGVNSGLTKIGCKWLAELPITTLQVQCNVIDGPGTVSLSSDVYYVYGSTCFTVYNKPAINSYGNGAVINCNGHTIIASRNGGTFVDVINASGVKIENCYIKNFPTPIVDTSNSLLLINDTIGTSTTAILAQGAYGLNMSNNIIENTTYGLISQSSSQGGIKNNLVNNAKTGMEFIGSGNYMIINNTVHATDQAFELVNATLNTFKNNNFLSATTNGIACNSGSQSNVDQGGNSCTGNGGCGFISKSASTCK